MATARVRRRKKGEDLTAIQTEGELPTLAQALSIREMEVANAQGSEVPMQSAQQSPMGGASARAMSEQPMQSAQSSRATVRRKAPKDADIFDERIGGYGKSQGPQESGEAAVRRIQRVKRKGK